MSKKFRSPTSVRPPQIHIFSRAVQSHSNALSGSVCHRCVDFARLGPIADHREHASLRTRRPQMHCHLKIPRVVAMLPLFGDCERGSMRGTMSTMAADGTSTTYVGSHGPCGNVPLIIA